MNAFMNFEFQKIKFEVWKKKSLECEDQTTRIQTSFFEIKILIRIFQRTFFKNKVWI